jgi:hypothetical protein
LKVSDLEANQEQVEVVAEDLEVRNEEAEMETVGTLEDGYGDRHVTAGRRRQPKKRTQGNGGSWRVDPPCRPCTAQGTWSSRIRQGHCCINS